MCDSLYAQCSRQNEPTMIAQSTLAWPNAVTLRCLADWHASSISLRCKAVSIDNFWQQTLSVPVVSGRVVAFVAAKVSVRNQRELR